MAEVPVRAVVGLPAFTIVGLPDAAVQAGKSPSSRQELGRGFPQRRITVSLVPADLKRPQEGRAVLANTSLSLLDSVRRLRALPNPLESPLAAFLDRSDNVRLLVIASPQPHRDLEPPSLAHDLKPNHVADMLA